MAKISIKDVKRLGLLAQLAIPDETSAVLAGELKGILEHDERLQKIDTNGIEVTGQVTGLRDVWREDRSVPCRYSREELLSNTPEVMDGYIKVKRVIQQP